MTGLSSGLDRRQARVHAVVAAHTEEDLDILLQAYGEAARLFKRSPLELSRARSWLGQTSSVPLP